MNNDGNNGVDNDDATPVHTNLRIIACLQSLSTACKILGVMYLTKLRGTNNNV